MSLFSMENPDPMIRLDVLGNILLMNPAAQALQEISYQEKKYPMDDFWKMICPEIDKESDRWLVEGQVNDQTFSFVCKYLPEPAYFNIYGRDITAEKEGQEEIKRLSLVASSNENGVLFTDPDGKINWANNGFCNLTGYTKEEIQGKAPIDLLRGPLTDKASLKEIVEAFEAGKNFLVELINYKKNGTTFWSRSKGQAVYNESGRLIQYFALIEDISQEKAQEDRLRILSLIAEENLNGVLITDADGRITWVNKGFTKMTGFMLEEVIGKKPGHFLQGPETNPETVRYLSNQIREGYPFICEILNYNKASQKYWLRIQGQAIRNQRGKITGYFALEEDITIERENQDALKKSEERWQFALEGAGDGVWEFNFQTREVFFSQQYKKMLGYSDEDFPNLYEEWESRVHADDKYILKETERDYRSGFVQNHQREFRMLSASGQYLWILDRGMVVSRTPDGTPLRIIGTHSDITDRKSTEQALQFKEEKYRNILANMHLGILEVDPEENILYANQSFCEISGFEESELIGRNARSLLVSGKTDVFMKKKTSLRKKGKSDAYEIAIKNKRGELRWWLVSGAPSYNDKGELIGSIGIHLDITEQRKLQDELVEARELAEASSKSKEVFLTNMSHEIRTPMHAISGMAELLSKTKLISRQRFYLEIIQSASENMLVILNDILDLSKLEARKLTLENIGFEVKLVLEKAIAVMQHRAHEKSLVLKLENIDFGISQVLIGDPFRLNQILFNLISNAIKFTERGQISVECHLKEQTENRQTLALQVTDTGIGMDKDFLEQLFEKFTQEHQSTSRKFGGTGLGMNITKELVELMHGQIEVESTKGKGTAFTISIPFEIGRHKDLPVLKKEPINPDIFNGLKILLVDDNDMNRLVANTMLENLGAKCVEAVNGKEAVEYMKNNSADLILMDIQMPVMDGLEATKLIKNQPHHKTPIIALTANALKSDNEKYLKAGMEDSLPKPFSEDELINLISKVLTKNKPKVRVGNQPNEGTEVHLYDLSFLEKMDQGNRSFINKMLELFLNQTPTMLLQMEKALQENDLQTISDIAHKMKPSLDNLGIVSLKDVVRNLEKANTQHIDLDEIKQWNQTLSRTLNLVFEKLKLEIQ
jgi:PAS domain S-box-containing protein